MRVATSSVARALPRSAGLTGPQFAALVGVRVLTALATAVTGYVHANLYVDGGYRVIHVVGPSFLLLSSGAFAVAALLLIGNSPLLRLGAAAVAAGALGGFVMSRTVGVFGFTERGLQPAPQALISLISELGALALLLSWQVLLHRSRGGRVGAGRPAWRLFAPWGRRVQRFTQTRRLSWPLSGQPCSSRRSSRW